MIKYFAQHAKFKWKLTKLHFLCDFYKSILTTFTNVWKEFKLVPGKEVDGKQLIIIINKKDGATHGKFACWSYWDWFTYDIFYILYFIFIFFNLLFV